MTNASNVELVLICLSVLSSSLLTATSAMPNVRHKYPLTALVISTMLVVGCLCIALTALCLAVLRRISLDAFSVALIGLLPSVQVAPTLQLGDFFGYLRMRKHRTLRPEPSNFRYVRHGRPFAGGSSTSTFIRRPACAMSLREDKGGTWHGRIIDFDDNVVYLLDRNNQSESFRWWKSILRARRMVVDPETALLDSPHSAICAMRLAVDIVVIGDFVLSMHGPSLRSAFGSDPDILRARQTGLATVCNAVFREFGIAEDWGKIDSGLNAFCEESLSLTRGRTYAAIFIILAETSILKDRDPGQLDWVDVVSAIAKTRDRTILKEVAMKWLIGWGFRPSLYSVHTFRE